MEMFARRGKSYQSQCKECQKKYHEDHKEHRNEMQRERRASDPNYKRENKERSKAYYHEHKLEQKAVHNITRTAMNHGIIPDSVGSRGGEYVTLVCQECGKVFYKRLCDYNSVLKHTKKEPKYCCYKCYDTHQRRLRAEQTK